MGLCCSGISSLWWKDCIYFCSYRNRRVGLSIYLISVVLLILSYSSLHLDICSAYAGHGSLFLMYRMCLWNLDLRLRLVCPT